MANPVLPEFDDSAPLRPARFGHIVLRSNHFDEMTRWYKAVLNARPLFERTGACFLTYDDEHHRVLIFSDPNATDRPATAAGVAHFAYLFNNLTELMSTYERLRDEEKITPTYCVNHGFQFSLYYHDPDKNEVELGCDNFATRQEINDWFAEGHFATNFYGYNFDPEEVYEWHKNGVSDEQVFADTYKGDAPDPSRPHDESK